MTAAELAERSRIGQLRHMVELWPTDPHPAFAVELNDALQGYFSERKQPPQFLMDWAADFARFKPEPNPVGRPKTTDDLAVAIQFYLALPDYPDATTAAKAIVKSFSLPYGPRSVVNRYKQQQARLAESGHTFDQVIAVREILENAGIRLQAQP
jgi:hypothetical protein